MTEHFSSEHFVSLVIICVHGICHLLTGFLKNDE